MVNIIISVGITIMIVVYPFQWIVDLMEVDLSCIVLLRAILFLIHVVQWLLEIKFVKLHIYKFLRFLKNLSFCTESIYNHSCKCSWAGIIFYI